MAEEDLVFAKNRHMFGGIEPSNMLKFSVSRVNNRIQITAQLPKNTIVDGKLLCTVGGAVIRRCDDDYPQDEFDGVFVGEITSSGVVTITDSTASTTAVHFYAAFPYSAQGVYNRSPKNRAAYLHPTVGYYYGFDLDLENNDPDRRVTYPSDVENADYAPAGMNFSTKTFSYGGWPSTAGVDFMPKPCILKGDGTVQSYLNPNDYSKTVDGADSSIASLSYMMANKKNAMMEWPKIYTHREVVNGIYKFRCCDKPLNDEWDCWCNYDINNNEIDHFYTAIYPAYITGSGDTLLPISMSGSDISTYSSFASSPIYIYNYPKKVGSDWNVEVLADRLLIQDLLVMMAKTTDGQTAYGYSYGDTTSNTGFQDKKGLFYGHGGSETGTTGPIKVFGMEGFFGWRGRLLAGLLLDGSDVKVKLTNGTHDGSSTTDYNAEGTGYITIASLADYMTTIGSYSGYISGTLNESYGRIPILKDGSNTTYECDEINYVRASSGATKYPYVGGSYSAVESTILAGGPFTINMTQSTSDSSTWGVVALSCKPTK